ETLNSQQAENLRNLAKLVRMLTRKQPLTIAEIAKRTDCTYAGAARRISVLTSRGCRIKEQHAPEQRQGKVGASPWSYRLIGNRASRQILETARRLRKPLTQKLRETARRLKKARPVAKSVPRRKKRRTKNS
ncbi:MAG TPA: HTH domain-containing protein, partial [Vicinamibacterales bacterium]|nr:HTH domain-containing protein [Vicinamibacterales bacterium]